VARLQRLHPTIFNIKKKFTEGLEMMNIVDRQYWRRLPWERGLPAD